MYKCMRHTITLIFIAVFLHLMPLAALGAILPCETLRDEIAEKLHRKGLTSEGLQIVLPNEVGTAKVVGSCNGGKNRIINAQSRADAAQTSTLFSMSTSDRSEIQKLANQSWLEQCIYHYPASWRASNPDEGVVEAKPHAGDYFDGFVFAVNDWKLSGGELLFVYAREFEDEEIQPSLKALGVSKAQFQSLKRLELEPKEVNVIYGHIWDKGMAILLGDKSEEPGKKVGNATIEMNFFLEGGPPGTDKFELPIYLKDKYLSAAVVAMPHGEVYPNPDLTDNVTAYYFRCSAESTMRVETFGKLCQMFIERAALDDRFGSGACAVDSSGKLVYQPDADTDESGSEEE